VLFSSATGYALRTLAILPEDGEYSLVKHLAAVLDLPGAYLAKILQTLAQEGILHSVRGPRGGFRLARPAQEITVGEVVAALEGTESLTGCVMGFPHCDCDGTRCPLHDSWHEVKTLMETSMTHITIRDLHHTSLRPADPPSLQDPSRAHSHDKRGPRAPSAL